MIYWLRINKKIFLQVTRVDSIVKIFDKTTGTPYTEDDLPKDLEEFYEHYTECYQRCLLLESTLASLQSATGHSYFPAIIGRRPPSVLNNTPYLQGKENISRTTNNSPPVVSHVINYFFFNNKLTILITYIISDAII